MSDSILHFPTSRAPLNRNSGGFVYFITSEPDEFVKIGWAMHSPAKRLRELQTGNHQPLRLMAYFPGSLEDERRLHETFAELRFRGEWFFNEYKLRDLIEYLSDNYPRPTNNCADRQRFEDATWDVILTGYEHPEMPSDYLAAYRSSGDGTLWLHLHPAEMAE